ncbi:hypothetical protein [Streptomyces sp. NBC_00280]|uniref:hypothetical protein n=1 Tax=Streptomyces sp. NBC_00280 TaxID=2975699 RepID=UPI003253E1EB
MNRRLGPPVPPGVAGGPAGGQDTCGSSAKAPPPSAVTSPTADGGQPLCAAAPGHPAGVDTVGASGVGGHSPALAGSTPDTPDPTAPGQPTGADPVDVSGPGGRNVGLGGGGGVVGAALRLSASSQRCVSSFQYRDPPLIVVPSQPQ